MQYEAMFIVSTTVENVDKLVDEARSVFTAQGASILHETSWGKRKLVTPIEKEKFGHFVILNFEAEPEAIKKINDKLKFTDHVLRFLIIKMPFVKDAAKHVQAPKTEAELAEDKKLAGAAATEKNLKEKAAALVEKEVVKEKEKKAKAKAAPAAEDLDKKLDEILKDDMNA